MKKFIDGAASVFNLNYRADFTQPDFKFSDENKSLQQQYWELTASHLRKQIRVEKDHQKNKRK